MSITPSSVNLASLQKGIAWMIVLFCSIELGSLVAIRYSPNILFSTQCAFFLWMLIVSIIHYTFLQLEKRDAAKTRDQKRRSYESNIFINPLLPGFARCWQWVIIATVFILVSLMGFLTFWLYTWVSLSEESSLLLRWELALFLTAAIILYFLIHYLSIVQRRLKVRQLDSLLILARLAFWNLMAATAVILIALSFNQNFELWLATPFLGLTLILAGESLLRKGLSFYQPHHLRLTPGPAGDSILLDFFFGNRQQIQKAISQLEIIGGFRWKESWILKFLWQAGSRLLFGIIVCGWLSTALTMVPLGTKGVLMHLGKLQAEPLLPGLHLALPWPFDTTTLIQTDLIHQISLGFDKDLHGAILWSEPHVTGEKNLLTGDGESLLTINVPIFYTISDPIAYLKCTSHIENLLQDLAERSLLHVIGSQNSLAIMISDRDTLATKLRASLQSEIDRIRAGLHIMFVGFQDVHPPLAVVPSFQAVISAQEEKEALIAQAEAKRAAILPAAQSQAAGLRSQAEAHAAGLILHTQASIQQFIELAEVDRAYPSLLRTELHFRMLENTLSRSNKILVAIPTRQIESQYLDFRNTNEIPPP